MLELRNKMSKVWTNRRIGFSLKPMSTFFRSTLRVLAAVPTTPATIPARTRVTTTLTGLAIHPTPLPHLLETYASTLAVLQGFPVAALYRQSVESITKERIEIISKLPNKDAATEQEISTVEDAIGLGYVEEIILMAEAELKLAEQMLELRWSVSPLLCPPAPPLTAHHTPAGRTSKSSQRQDSGSSSK